MSIIAEMLDAAPGITLTPELTEAPGRGQALRHGERHAPVPLFDLHRRLRRVDRRGGAQARRCKHTYGEAITPQLESAIAVAVR